MIEDPVIIFALGNITGSTFMFIVYDQWQQYKQDKMAEGLSDMAEGIDEEELDL